MAKLIPSNVRAFMIAVGETHQKMAEHTLPRVEKHTGLKVELITEGEPFTAKLNLLERSTKAVFFVDTDAVMFDWSWEEFQLPGFNVCFDDVSPAWAGHQHLATLFNPATSINTGMMLVSQEYRGLFQEALLYRARLEQKKFPYMLGDQTALNLAISETHTRVNILPKKYNWQTMEEHPKVPEGVYLAHLIGGTIPSPTEKPRLGWKLQRVLDLCRRHPYN